MTARFGIFWIFWAVLIIDPAWADEPVDPKLNLVLSQAPVASVLEALAQQANTNLILVEPLDRPISIQLNDVSIDEAFAWIAELADLEVRMMPGAKMIASKAHWQSVDAQQPLITKAITLMHRDAAEVMRLLSPSLSNRGDVQLDESANRLLIRETQAGLGSVLALLDTIDQPAGQVLIESRIVIANRDFNRALGLRLGVDRADDSVSDRSWVDASSELALADAAGRLKISLLSARYQLDAELSAMEASGQGQVISTPRLMVANRAEAFIQQGVAVPFEAVQSGEGGNAGAVSVQFREAVLALKATPLILANGQVQLDLHITQDTVGQIFQTGRGGSVPSIDTRQLGTRVSVGDGQTLVLGGIFQEQDASLVAGVPGLSAIPGVGRLFQRTRQDDQRRELLIFITPIVQPLQ